MLRNNLGLKDIVLVNTERKQSVDNKVPGVVICTLQNPEDRTKVLQAKNQLKRSEQYFNVFIYKDQSVEESTLNQNLKTIGNVLKEKGCDISLKGTRVISHVH
ncbi:hypothetical protein DPMN_164495 [Dreissena polymorpha]|uniref:Uncharacterized protein n=1 Tax=Dreissena polymorpha TaxID=45954 RepID=A0A9D4EW07_DREPO|nr:hypothetical protein DPMN_164495 [Dreissena polymorpha]